MRRIAKTLATVVCVIVVHRAFVELHMPFQEIRSFQAEWLMPKTKEPIEGAVVVAYWYEATTTTTGGESTRIKDVEECVDG